MQEKKPTGPTLRRQETVLKNGRKAAGAETLGA